VRERGRRELKNGKRMKKDKGIGSRLIV